MKHTLVIFIAYTLLAPIAHGQFGDFLKQTLKQTTGLDEELDAAETVIETGEALSKTLEDITPEQEYYIGRSVITNILKTYKPYSDEKALQYLNKLTQSIALASTKPHTYGGYHSLILDTDNINAVAAPGGFILVTRGMIRLCSNEDELAAVIAHEIAHVELGHALRSIDRSRFTDLLFTAGKGAARTWGSDDLAQATNLFGDSVDDITSTLLNNGYSKSLEYEADEAALRILHDLGYASDAMITMLHKLKTHVKPSDVFHKTHPDPEDRIEEAREHMDNSGHSTPDAARTARFLAHMENI